MTKSPITVVFTSRVTYRTSANINKEVKGVIARTDPCSTLPQVGTVSSVDLSLSLSLCHLEGIEPLAGCSCVSAATYPGSYTMCAAGGGGGGGREFMQTSWTGRPWVCVAAFIMVMSMIKIKETKKLGGRGCLLRGQTGGRHWDWLTEGKRETERKRGIEGKRRLKGRGGLEGRGGLKGRGDWREHGDWRVEGDWREEGLKGRVRLKEREGLKGRWRLKGRGVLRVSWPKLRGDWTNTVLGLNISKLF